MNDLLNFDFTNPEYLKLVFEKHCKTLNAGEKITISNPEFGEHEVANFADLSEKFPQLNDDFKKEMKLKYHF